jgi:hypothetical protein
MFKLSPAFTSIREKALYVSKMAFVLRDPLA